MVKLEQALLVENFSKRKKCATGCGKQVQQGDLHLFAHKRNKDKTLDVWCAFIRDYFAKMSD